MGAETPPLDDVPGAIGKVKYLSRALDARNRMELPVTLLLQVNPRLIQCLLELDLLVVHAMFWALGGTIQTSFTVGGVARYSSLK